MAKAQKKPGGKPERDEAREERIKMEIVVDAYDEAERAMGWYSYLEDTLHVPSRPAASRNGRPRRCGPATR